MCHCSQVGSENNTGPLGDVIDPGELSPATIAAIQTLIDNAIAGLPSATVDSVNGETGVVTLDSDDISDTGKTHKFTTAGDISKLAGIESGATADQTATEILTAIKTVDGSGSGLDADLLDGLNSSDFQAASAKLDSLSALNSGGVDYFVRLGAGETDYTLQEIDGNYGSSSPSFSNVGATTINSLPAHTEGTYTPTYTNVANVASFGTVSALSWSRDGNRGRIFGRISIDPTSASVNTEFGISLPAGLASNFSLFTDVGGSCICVGSVSISAGARADTVNDRITIKYINTAEIGAQDFSLDVSLRII